LINLQNVIKLFEIIPLKSHTCIITELCDGGDLSKLIKEHKKMPESKAIDVLSQIINGYRGISRFGIVHRDLKPANIFFSDSEVKIADFGFAIRNADLKKHSNYNVGSPVYMPL
jgi:serine/threonine protein kinase